MPLYTFTNKMKHGSIYVNLRGLGTVAAGKSKTFEAKPSDIEDHLELKKLRDQGHAEVVEGKPTKTVEETKEEPVKPETPASE